MRNSWSSSGSVGVAVVFDAEHDDVGVGSDAVQHAVRTASSGVDSGQVPTQPLAGPVGVVEQHAGHELEDCGGDCFREARADGSDSRRSQNELEGARRRVSLSQRACLGHAADDIAGCVRRVALANVGQRVGIAED